MIYENCIVLQFAHGATLILHCKTYRISDSGVSHFSKKYRRYINVLKVNETANNKLVLRQRRFVVMLVYKNWRASKIVLIPRPQGLL